MDENTTVETASKIKFTRKGLIVVGATVGLILAAGYVITKKAPAVDLALEV